MNFCRFPCVLLTQEIMTVRMLMPSRQTNYIEQTLSTP